MQAIHELAMTKKQVFQGHMMVEGKRIEVEFEAPIGASCADKDAAFLAALAQQVRIDYFAVGEGDTTAAYDVDAPITPFEGTPYDQADFDRNPVKYELFRTAIIAEVIPTSPDLKVGQLVAISYWCTRINAAHDNDRMPIYFVWMQNEDRSKQAPRTLYACALKGFCL